MPSDRSQTNPVTCALRGHSWKLQRLRRGPSRVEVCERCGAVENYFDIFKEFASADG